VAYFKIYSWHLPAQLKMAVNISVNRASSFVVMTNEYVANMKQNYCYLAFIIPVKDFGESIREVYSKGGDHSGRVV
jgi:hypothetical protein